MNDADDDQLDRHLQAEVEKALHRSLEDLVSGAYERRWGNGDEDGNAGDRVPRRPMPPEGTLTATADPPDAE